MTADEILEDFLASVDAQIDTSVGSFVYDIFYPLSRRVLELFQKVDELTDNAFALTAEGRYLDRITSEQAVSRHMAKKSEGVLTITGDRGTIIPIGSKAASSNLLFSTTAAATIPESLSIDVPAECYSAGSVGNVAAGMINRFPIRIPGCVSVTNKAAFSGGYDTETDGDLRSRYYEKVSNPHGSGNAADYRMWAMEVGGVGAAEVTELWNGNGTVKVVITDANGLPADSELLQAVREHIETVRPLCVAVTVEAASSVNIAISVSVTAEDKYAARDQITAAIKEYLSLCGSKVFYSRIGAAIVGCSAVEDYSGLKINNGTSNVSISSGSIPVLTEVKVT